jgi:hypothetical protein
MAGRPSSMATVVALSPAFLRPNGPPHHIRHAKPHARHLLPGLDPHRRPLPPDRRRCRHPLLWPRCWGPPRAEPSSSAGAQRPLDARAVLGHRRRRPPRRSREPGPLPCFRRQAARPSPFPSLPLWVSFSLYDRRARLGNRSHLSV